jgi:lipoprotein-anchoring transpeptidase ErfK/SrfK
MPLRLFAPLVAVLVILGASAAEARELVNINGYEPGTIVVRTSERRLYYVIDHGRALRYPVGVGKAGKAWSGTAHVAEMIIKPGWSPPNDVRRDNPRLPRMIPGDAANNPLGAAALGLDRGNYAIHGTNRPDSIGRFVSYGCIRMHNADIMDLYRRVHIGTRVVVLP